MAPRAQTCLLLLIGLLTHPGTGGTIGRPIFLETRDGKDTLGQDRTGSHPFWKIRHEDSRPRNVRIGSPEVGGVWVSRVPLEVVATITPEPLPNTPTVEPQQVGTSKPPMREGPLLDEDELVAFEMGRLNRTVPPATNSSTEPTVSVPVAVSEQSELDKSFSSQLAEVLKSILIESTSPRTSTTKCPYQPPTEDVTSRKPPVSSAVDAATLDEFLPQLEQTLKDIITEHKPKDPTTNPHQSPLQPPRVPPANTEEVLGQILPTLEEALGSIFKDSEVLMSTTTSRTVLAPTQLPKVPQNDTKEALGQILPTLEETLGGILKDSEALTSTTTSRPVLAPVSPTKPDSRQRFAAVLTQLEDAIRSILKEAVAEQEAAAKKSTPPPTAWRPSPPTTKDYGFGEFVPELERVFGGIMRDQGSDHSPTFPNAASPTSTVKTPIPLVTEPTEQQPLSQNVIVTDSEPLFQAVKSTLEDVFKHQDLEANRPQAQP